MKLRLDGREYEVTVDNGAVTVNGQPYQVSLKGHGLTWTVTVNGRTMRVDVGEAVEDGARPVNVDGKVWQAELAGAAATPGPGPERPAAAPAATERRRATRGAVTAQMAGRVLRIDVQPGDTVESGALLLVLEAMKMENEVRAPRAGVIKSVPVAVGDRVSNGDPLVVFDDVT